MIFRTESLRVCKKGKTTFNKKKILREKNNTQTTPGEGIQNGQIELSTDFDGRGEGRIDKLQKFRKREKWLT